MPRFQGIPVDAPTGGRFGGVPVDEAEINTWDQPGETVQGTLEERYTNAGIDPNEYDPTEGMSWYEKYRAGLGKSLVDTGRGLVQAGTSAASYFADQNPMLVSEDTREALRQSLTEQQAEQAERERLDAPLMDTGWGQFGNVVGTVGQIVGPGMAARGTQTAAALLPTTIRGNAAQGAVVGAIQPTTSEAQRVGNAAIGTGGGAAGAAAPRIIGGTVNALARLSPPIREAQQVRRAAGVINQFAADPQRVLAAAQNPQVLVPGTRPTLAEVAEDPGMNALQKTLSMETGFSNELSGRIADNNLARVREIERAFGGADSASAAAVRESRDQAARTILRPIDRLPMSSLNKVVAGVQRLSEKHQASPAVRTAMEAVKAELPNIRTVGDAHAVRQYIGQLISGQVEGRAGAKLAKRELMTVQNLLDREMRASYPEWGRFLREYKAASREADQIDAGVDLLASGRSTRTATDDPQLTPAGFARVARRIESPRTRDDQFRARALTDEQRQAVDSIRRDLERFDRSRSDVTRIGSDTFKNAVGGNTFQSAAGPVGAAVVEPVSGIALMGLNQIRQAYGSRVGQIVQEAMLDPARAAEILATLPAGQRSEIVRAVAPLLARTSSVSGVVSPALAE